VKPVAATQLEAEFRTFARHLARTGGTPYQQAKYVEAHSKLNIEPAAGFDRFLVDVARLGGGGVWLADAYTGFLARKSTVRSKLMLTLALLECAPPSFVELDAPSVMGLWSALFATALRGFEFVLAFLLSVLVFIPARLWFAVTGPRR
jgi:hypothetical protein